MTVRLGIIMDPIASINFKKDSSLAMLLAAQARGWQLFYMEQRDLYQLAGEARARMQPLQVFNNADGWFTLGEELDQPLAELQVILMRKDPPFDNEFIYSTYLLEQAERAGTLVVNRPQSLRDCNEKFFATAFSAYTPDTWSAVARTFCGNSPRHSVTSFSNPWTEWAARRSSATAPETPICRSFWKP